MPLELPDFDELADEVPTDDPDDALRSLLLDWHAFWAMDHGEAEWIAEPVIPAKRSVALFAPGGTGKSLLALWIAACIATGRTIFGHRGTPRRVLYLDYEMTADDLAERLENMGFGPDVDLGGLHYALLPSLPGLDQPEGGKAVVRLAELVDAELVIIDTFGRAVHGDENEADTVRAWYRWTGIHLKHAGRAFLRVDHAGKDLEKGQRGTSAKNDDVDVVWQMTKGDASTFTLKAKKRRMGWVPEKVELWMRDDDQLEFTLLHGTSYPAGTKEVADLLDAIGVPSDASMRVAQRAVRDAGHKARNDLIRAAVKYRIERFEPVDNLLISVPRKSGHAARADTSGTPSGTPHEETEKPQVNRVPQQSGHTGAHPPSVDGCAAPSLEGAHPTPPDSDDFF